VQGCPSPPHFLDDFVGRLVPDERLGIVVPVLDPGGNGRLPGELAPRRTVSRGRGWVTSAIAVTLLCACTDGSARDASPLASPIRSRTTTASPSSSSTNSTRLPMPAGPPRATRWRVRAAWVVAENRKPGTTSWKIPKGTPLGIEGYLDHVSVERGQSVRLFASTNASRFRMEAYRLGYARVLPARIPPTPVRSPGGPGSGPGRLPRALQPTAAQPRRVHERTDASASAPRGKAMNSRVRHLSPQPVVWTS
jgi:hypothetical protein